MLILAFLKPYRILWENRQKNALSRACWGLKTHEKFGVFQQITVCETGLNRLFTLYGIILRDNDFIWVFPNDVDNIDGTSIAH